MNMYSLKELQEKSLSKDEVFENCPYTFDYAIPQSWVDLFGKWCKKYCPEITYSLIISTTCWAYTGNFGRPIFGCFEVMWAYMEYIREN